MTILYHIREGQKWK